MTLDALDSPRAAFHRRSKTVVDQVSTLGMMQPYFYPYLGYFALIQRSEHWVVFDDVQYIRHGWVDRNRILHPAEGWQYVKVELDKAPRETQIRHMTCKESDWSERIIRQLEHYKKRAPFYGAVMELLRSTFAERPRALDRMLVRTLERTCEYVGLPFQPMYNSELSYERPADAGPGDWALLAARHLAATKYINPPGGRDLFDPVQWREAGIELRFLTMPAVPYRQLRPVFEPHLSIIDALMFNSPEAVRQMLQEATVEE